MAELRDVLAGLGATDVQTYIQSGNVLCVPPRDPNKFDRALERATEKEHGFFREAISRTPRELKAALDAHPFEVVDPRFILCRFHDRVAYLSSNHQGP